MLDLKADHNYVSYSSYCSDDAAPPAPKPPPSEELLSFFLCKTSVATTTLLSSPPPLCISWELNPRRFLHSAPCGAAEEAVSVWSHHSPRVSSRSTRQAAHALSPGDQTRQVRAGLQSLTCSLSKQTNDHRRLFLSLFGALLYGCPQEEREIWPPSFFTTLLETTQGVVPCVSLPVFQHSMTGVLARGRNPSLLPILALSRWTQKQPA